MLLVWRSIRFGMSFVCLLISVLVIGNGSNIVCKDSPAKNTAAKPYNGACAALPSLKT